jgi:hypothetical protein
MVGPVGRSICRATFVVRAVCIDVSRVLTAVVFVWDLWFLVWGVALEIATVRYAREGRSPSG